MRLHSFKHHTSAAAIIRQFFLVPDENGRSESTMLKKIRKKGYWAYVDVPNEESEECIVHFWHRTDAPVERLVTMIAHELGHIADGGPHPEFGQGEEDRADEYAQAASETFSLLMHLGLIKL